MPIYTIDTYALDIPRKAFFLDTNVIVAAFYPNDKWHDNAKIFLEDIPDQFIVPFPVVLESWGMIVGSRKRYDIGIELVSWLGNPGNALILPSWQELHEKGRELCIAARIDLVDALLICYANEVNEKLDLTPKIPIASFDSKDYIRCFGSIKLKFSFYDMKTFELQF